MIVAAKSFSTESFAEALVILTLEVIVRHTGDVVADHPVNTLFLALGIV